SSPRQPGRIAHKVFRAQKTLLRWPVRLYNRAMTKLCYLCCLLFISFAARADEAKPAIRVLVWSEGTEPASVYPDGIRGAIASIFKDHKDVVAKTATLTDPEQGLSEAALKNTDVVIWWGHQKHGDVKDEHVNR